jgi:hypothetical protein
MPDYSNGKIYMLGLPPFLPYYGSTVQTLKRRMSSHKKDARAFLNGTRTDRCYSNELVLRPGCKIELVEAFPCSSHAELLKREGWYQLNNPCVNKKIAGRTKQEYYQIKKEHQKKYYDDNKEKYALYKKEYWKANKEKTNNDKKQKIVCEMCGSTVSKSSMTGHKRTKKGLRTTKKDKSPERTYTEGGLAMLRDFGE